MIYKWFISTLYLSVDIMFTALSDCQILHPDPQEQGEGTCNLGITKKK